MGTNFQIRSGDRVPLASPRFVPLLLACCELGAPGTVYSFEPGDDVVGTLGGGAATLATLHLHATAGCRVEVSPCVPTYPALPSVTKVGGGPSVTVALTSGSPGPLFGYTIVASVLVGGAGGAAQAEIAYDGSSYVETIIIPAEVPAVLRGAVDIKHGASIEALHLDFTSPSADVVTFGVGSLAAAAAGLKALTTSSMSPVTLTASDLLAPGKALLLANPRRLTFTTDAGGTPGDAPATVVITGTRLGVAVSETLNLSQTAGTVTSAKEYDVPTSLAYAAGDGTAASISIGYASAYATPAELAAAFDVLALAAGLAVNARVYEDSAGPIYLELYSTSAGSGVTQTIDAAASTADTLLGFTSGASNLTATGATAKTSLPYTGVDLVWPASSDYEAGTTYTIPLVGPRPSVGSIADAAEVGRDEFSTHSFGFMATAEAPASASAARTILDTLADLGATWLADPDDPIFVDCIVGTALHTASATRATNNTNIAANDAALQAAMASSPASPHGNVAIDDVYIVGSQALHPGTYRVSASIVGAAQRASGAKIAANPGEGLVESAVLVGPDGLTLARNEAKATTKLGKINGPGYWALKSTSGGLAAPKFEVCATRAGATSRLRSPGAVAVALEICRLVHGEVEFYVGQTWETDPASPKAAAVEETDTRADHLRAFLKDYLQPKGDDPNVSAYSVAISANTIADDGVVGVAIPFNPLAEVGTVNVVVTATGATLAAA